MTQLLVLFWQLSCLLIVSVGWGAWIGLLAGQSALQIRTGWLWCSLVGFCAHALLLQGLVYLGMPLKHTAWPAFGLAILGLILAFRQVRQTRGTGWRPAWLEGSLLLGVFVAAVAIHGAAVLWLGNSDYYGRGRYDQANYVVTAQFLVEKPFSTGPQDVGLQPWLARALETKEQRITQSVAHGALAVVSGGDCQQAYGAMTVFFLGLLAVVVTAWLRGYEVPPGLAALGGAGAALSPAVTALQLDGYFSQTGTLFVPLALAALVAHPAPLGRLNRLGAGILLGYWIGAYTETSVVGAGMVVALRLVSAGSWLMRCRDLIWIAVVSLLINPGFVVRFPEFLAEQWMRTGDPNLLSALFPESGTWLGWSRQYLDLGPGPMQSAVMLFVGILVLVFLFSAWFLPARQRWPLLATVLVPVTVLVWLGVQPVLAKYPFAKLLAGFTPLWIGVAVLGINALTRRMPAIGLAVVALIFGAGAASALPQQWAVIQRQGILAELSSPGLHRARQAIKAHPKRSYLVASDHPLVAQWLCYFAREANVYLDRRHLGDRIVPSEMHAFRRLPPLTTQLWWLDLERTGPVHGHAPACAIQVRGAIEEGDGPSGRYYLARNELWLNFDRPSREPTVQLLWLDVVAIPLPETPNLELELIGPDQRRQRIALSGPRMLRFHLPLLTGRNEYSLHVKPMAIPPIPSGPTVMLKALSLDPVTGQSLASDPAPIEYVQ